MLPANQCTSETIIPHHPANIRQQFDSLMEAARAVCNDFTGYERQARGAHAVCWRFEPACRAGQTWNTNLLTVWTNSASLTLDIRPHCNGITGPQMFELDQLPTYQQRMAERFQTLQQL